MLEFIYYEFFLYYIFMPILVLGIVIFIHELGHFVAARYFKILTPVFSIGFGKEIWGRTDKNGTRWKLSLFPIGGYVSVDSHDNHPLYQRTIIAIAGPVANFIFAIVMMIFLSIIFGMPATSPSIVGVNTNSGAYSAGLLPRDKIISLDGKLISKNMESIREIVESAHGDSIKVDIEREGKLKTVLVPVRFFSKVGDFGEDKKQKMMGVVFAGQNWKLSAINSVAGVPTSGDINLARAELIKNSDKNIIVNFGIGKEREDFLVFVDSDLNKDLLDPEARKYSSFILADDTRVDFVPVSFIQSVSESFKLVYTACKKTLGVLYQIIKGQKDTGHLGGVVAISTMTGDVSERVKEVGFYFMFRFIAILSINIGFINLLPLPMLDGGHLLFYAMEAVRGRPPSPKVKGYVYGFGIMFIIMVMIMVTYRDIVEKLADN